MKIQDILTLEDKKDYIIVSKVDYDNKTYLCLVDINDNKNVKFCYLNNDRLIMVDKESISGELALKLLNQMKDVTMKFMKDNG